MPFWDQFDRLTCVVKSDGDEIEQATVEYRYCPTCGGALSERLVYDATSGTDPASWLRYEYEGLNLLRIDEVYDKDDNGKLEDPDESGDAWRVLNTYVHAPGQIGQIVRNRGYVYWEDGSVTHHDMYYAYDALGNTLGVFVDCAWLPFEMDAFGNRIPGSVEWADMDSPGPKEHLTGKMMDELTGLYYFHARWYDPEVGRFVGRDPVRSEPPYSFVAANPVSLADPTGRSPSFRRGLGLCEACAASRAHAYMSNCYTRRVKSSPNDSKPDKPIRDVEWSWGANCLQHCLAACYVSRDCGAAAERKWSLDDAMNIVDMGYTKEDIWRFQWDRVVLRPDLTGDPVDDWLDLLNNAIGFGCARGGTDCLDCCIDRWKSGVLRCRGNYLGGVRMIVPCKYQVPDPANLLWLPGYGIGVEDPFHGRDCRR